MGEDRTVGNERSDEEIMMDTVGYLKERIDLATEDVHEYKRILEESYYKKSSGREIDRKADMLTAFANEIPVVLDPCEPIVGSMRFSRKFENLNKGHVAVDYASLLEGGIPMLYERLSRLSTPDSSAFRKALDAFVILIGRYESRARAEGMTEVAESLAPLKSRAPKSFREAIQLLWMAHLFLHAEGSAAGFSFGRFDKYAYPFYERDITSGILTREGAKELLSAFYLKCCEADESQALTVGGDIENELTFLVLEVCRELSVKQPSVCVRTSEKSSDALWHSAIKAVKAGSGNPALFNDAVFIKGLEGLGIEKCDSQNYALIGCYEANPDGCTYGVTSSAVFFYLHDILTEFIELKPDFDDFSKLYFAFLDFFKRKYDTDVLSYAREDRWISRVRGECPSPFESLLLGGCLDSGVCAEHGGAKYTLAGVNMLGFGTLVDSLYAIKKLVFDEKRYTLSYYLENVRGNFPDTELLAAARGLKGKYGTADPETDALARELAEFLHKTVSEGSIYDGVTPNPGLFVFLHDIDSESYPATPDGRQRGERVSYGIAPSEIAKGKSLTSLLRSASAIPQRLFPNGTPILLSLDKRDVKGESGEERLIALIKGYFRLGGSTLQINLQNRDTLVDAREHPERYPDLLVRISGFSDRFTRQREDIKDALIDRAE